MKRTILICNVLFFFSLYAAYPQSYERLTNPYINSPIAPEASSMMRNLNFPVSYYNGLPEIKIPIYEIVVGDLRMPIELSYHASGNRADEVAGLVGLNWSINLAPSIIRKINGADDFDYYIGRPNNAQELRSRSQKEGMVPENPRA